MKMKIKRIAMEHFKGISERIIDLTDNTDIRGANGTGKSTLASAFYFVLCDSDYQLNNKPMVQPLGNSEVKPHVRLWLDIDGREITVDKTQKTTIKVDENSGKTTATTTNTYAINDVPKSLRDFTQYFNDLGIDLDKLLALSHPDVFTKDNSAKGREKMRSVLFEMVSEMSDLDIAKDMEGVSGLTIELGRGYKLDEIKAMNQATIKRIESDDGKNNELIDARIQGLIEGKAEIDAKAIQSDLDNLNKKKSQILEMMNDDAPNELGEKIRELTAQKQEIIDKANAEVARRYTEIELQLVESAAKKRETLMRINKAKSSADGNKMQIFALNEQLENLRKEYKEESEKNIYVAETCPYCGQALPEEDVERTRKKMADKKAEKLEQLKTKAETVKQVIETAKANLMADENLIAEIEKDLSVIEAEENFLVAQTEKNKVNPYQLPEVVALQSRIDALTAQMNSSSDDTKERLNDEYNKVSEEIENLKAKIKQAEQNDVIDTKISELRQKKSDDEVTKAKAEKMLFEVAEFEKHKNNLLTDEINKHFDLVDWRLFEYQKNGDYKQCCYPTYEGKAIDVDTNTALSVAMRLDIATSLQRFYRLNVPVFIDKAESLDTQTRKDISDHSDTQIIWLTVSDCELEVLDIWR